MQQRVRETQTPKNSKTSEIFSLQLVKNGNKTKTCCVYIFLGADAVLCFAVRIFKCGSKMCPYGENSSEFVLISKTKKRFFLISYKMKERWMTDDAKTMDWLSHTSPSILMVVSTFLVKKHLNIYVWQTKRETFLCWFWEKSQNERNPPSSSNNFNKSSAGWQPRER